MAPNDTETIALTLSTCGINLYAGTFQGKVYDYTDDSIAFISGSFNNIPFGTIYSLPSTYQYFDYPDSIN